MFCKNCGTQLDDSQKFCSNCGTPVETVILDNPEVQATPEVQEATQTTPEPTPVVETPPAVQPAKSAPAAGDDKKIVLQIFAGIFAAINAVMFIIGFFKFFGGVFRYFGNVRYYPVMYKIFGLPIQVLNLLYSVSLGLIAVVLVLMLFKWTKEETKNYFITLIEACLLPVIISIICSFVSIFASIGSSSFVGNLLGIFGAFWPLLRAVIICGGVFGILYLMGVQPLDGITKDSVKELAISAPKAILEVAKEFIAGLTSKSGSAKATTSAKTVATAPVQNATATQTATPVQNTVAPNKQPVAPKAVPTSGPAKLKTDRNIIVYILLSIITCGIYGLFFLHSWIQDVNTACKGDGDDTPGLLMFYLLTIVTCGIYSYVWYYKLANRLSNNATRYGLRFTDTGGSILLWMILGSFLCGIGPLVALHKLFSNTNAICQAYNNL